MQNDTRSFYLSQRWVNTSNEQPLRKGLYIWMIWDRFDSITFKCHQCGQMNWRWKALQKHLQLMDNTSIESFQTLQSMRNDLPFELVQDFVRQQSRTRKMVAGQVSGGGGGDSEFLGHFLSHPHSWTWENASKQGPNQPTAMVAWSLTEQYGIMDISTCLARFVWLRGWLPLIV